MYSRSILWNIQSGEYANTGEFTNTFTLPRKMYSVTLVFHFTQCLCCWAQRPLGSCSILFLYAKTMRCSDPFTNAQRWKESFGLIFVAIWIVLISHLNRLRLLPAFDLRPICARALIRICLYVIFDTHWWTVARTIAMPFFLIRINSRFMPMLASHINAQTRPTHVQRSIAEINFSHFYSPPVKVGAFLGGVGLCRCRHRWRMLPIRPFRQW